jgi:nucleotide-binding universal stress UspA family protein
MAPEVLVAMDDSEMAAEALRYALDTFPEGAITVLTVVGGATPMLGESMGLAMSDDLDKAAKEHAQPVVERARDLATDHQGPFRVKIRIGNPAREIVDAAGEYDTVVIGSHGGSLGHRLLVGNVAKKVLMNAPIPVTVVR